MTLKRVPEGDTIYRAAARCTAPRRPDIVRFESVFPALTRVHDDHPLTAMSVERVQSSGKHLLMHFSGGLVLRTHMRMHGSWHIYRPGERWRQNRRDMRVLVATADFEAVGFNIPVAEFIKADPKHALAKHRVLGKLGPDALAADFDRDEAIRRLRSRPAVAHRRRPPQPASARRARQRLQVGSAVRVRDQPVRDRRRAHRQRARAAWSTPGGSCCKPTSAASSTGLTTYTGSRRTTGRDNPAERLWVYGRGRLPCRRCGTAIDVKKHGTDARLTYWCPECQTS